MGEGWGEGDARKRGFAGASTFCEFPISTPSPRDMLTYGLPHALERGNALIMFFRFTPRRLLWTVVVPIALIILIIALRGEV